MTPERFQEIKREAMDPVVAELVAELERYMDPKAKPLVVIESPLAGDYEANKRFARLALLDSIHRGEAPFAGHLLYTQVLDDKSATERELGISCHLAHVRRAQRVAVYANLGVSKGMDRAIDLAVELGIPWETRSIT